MASSTRRKLYRKVAKRSMCKGKKISKPNRCKRVKNCNVASGKKRSYCRKTKSTRYSKRARRS